MVKMKTFQINDDRVREAATKIVKRRLPKENVKVSFLSSKISVDDQYADDVKKAIEEAEKKVEEFDATAAKEQERQDKEKARLEKLNTNPDNESHSEDTEEA
jgi:hypothetical protein